MMGNIFDKYHLHDFIHDNKKRLLEKIEKLEITDSINSESLIEKLKEEFTIYPINIKDAEPSAPNEILRKINNDWGETVSQKIFEVFITIPFEGDAKLFTCIPSRSTVVYLDESVKIFKNRITATIILESLDDNIYFAKVNHIIETLNTNLPRIHDEIAPWNNNLKTLIRQSLETRKGVISKKIDFMEKIGLKINPHSTDYLIPPSLTKKIIPTPVTDSITHLAKEKIPNLQQDVYEDIKQVLYQVGMAIERKPSIYKDKHEEDLRDIFLLFLETRYEATSGVGEAFNKKGKTDILLKYSKDGTNIFVAECKVWKGQKTMIEALNQLLSYLTHRDSKTALIFFVNQKDITSTLNTVKNEIVKHSNFSKHIKDTNEFSISYEFYLPDDERKKIQIEVMLFHFPLIS